MSAGGQERWDIDAGNKSNLYFVNEQGVVTERANWGLTQFDANLEGMLLIPATALGWRFGDGTAKEKIDSFYLTSTPDAVFAVTLGEIGYYKGDPANGGVYTMLKQPPVLSEEKPEYSGSDEGQYYAADSKYEFPKFQTQVVVPSITDETLEYPFRTGEMAFANAYIWSVPTVSATGADNFQRFNIKFDETTDLSDATYIAIHYNAKAGKPGIIFSLKNAANATYGMSGQNDVKSYMLNTDGSIVESSKSVNGGNFNTSGAGALLLEVGSMKGDASILGAITALQLQTNNRWDYNFEIMIGEIGYYTGTPGNDDLTFHKLIDLTSGAADGQYTCNSTNAEDCGTVRVNKIDRMVYGDVTLTWTATGKTANQFGIWDGGSMGKVEMVTDSYGDDAAQLTCTGANPTGDKYTATTIADGIKWQWAGLKGVTLWARNDSDIEVSFNLEMDVTNPEHVKNNGNSHNARHNIKQGGRFWLYDVNTGKQTIYMTRPCVTLPVGFEGWVYVPFADFYQADWSVNEGAMPRSMFVNSDGTMAEKSYVSYLAITVFSGDYTNKPFSINKIGAYATTPTFSSAVLGNVDKSIPSLMDLPALPQSNGEDK